MKKKTLPSLPYGEGSLSYWEYKGHEYIRYRKMVNKKYIVVYADTVKECLALMKEKEKESATQSINQGTSLDNSGKFTILYDGIQSWLKTFKFGSVKNKTYDTMEGTLNNQIKGSAISNLRVSEITSADIQNTLNKIQNTKSLSTTKKTYLLLNQYFQYYYKNDINNNPMNNVPIPKQQKVFEISSENVVNQDEITALSDEEITKLTAELSKPYEPGKGGYRNGYGILFIMWVFCRIGEALALQWKDVDIENHTINIYKEYVRTKDRDKDGNFTGTYSWILTTPKSAAGVRRIPICDLAVEYILKYKEVQQKTEDNDFVFQSTKNNPLSPQFLNNNLSRALSNANISTKVTIHGLRHTGISYFIRHGVSDKVISELAGHSDVGITNKIYYNVIEEQKRNAIKNIDDIIKKERST